MKFPAALLLFIWISGFAIAACSPRVDGNLPSTTQTAARREPTSTSGATSVPQDEQKPACFETYASPLAFAPDNSRLLVWGNAGVQIFDLAAGVEQHFLPAPVPLSRPVAELAPDGEMLAWAFDDNSIQLVHIRDGTELSSPSAHDGPITKLRFDPAGERLYSASHDGWVRVWSLSGEPVAGFQPGGGEVMGIGISPDGSVLATMPFDGPVRLWDTRDFALISELGGTGGYDTSDIAFSADGQFLAADLAAGLTIWQAPEYRPRGEIINSMAFAFSPAGDAIAYAELGEENVIKVVSLDDMQVLQQLAGHQAPVWELVFSPDAMLLASADDQGIRIWSLAAGETLLIGKPGCP